MNKTIDYFLTPQSPFVYLGHARFAALAARHGAQVQIKPCDIGKVFAASGGLQLAQRPPQRQAYRLVELERWRRHLGVPLNLHPAFFPVSGDAASRLIIAAQQAHGVDAAMRVSGLVSHGVWAGERNIADAQTLALIGSEAGLDGDALLKASEGEAVQAVYASNTEEAIAAGVFGVPWYVYNGEAFWGQDRLEFLERALAE